MLKHRCPWCGEPIGFSVLFEEMLRTYKLGYLCPHCNKKLTKELPLTGTIFIIFSLITILFLQPNLKILRRNMAVVPEWHTVITDILFVISVISLFLLIQGPYTRYYSKKEKHLKAEHEALKRKADTQIQWYSHKDGGLWLPRLRLLNHEILPAYFLDKNGVLMSGGLCVALTHIHWKGWKQCFCSIELVLEDAPAAVLEHGNRFYLYYREQQIAEGVVQTAER